MSTSRLLSVLVLLSAIWIASHALTIAQTPTPPPASPTPPPPTPPSPTLSGERSFAAGGDSILLRPISVYEQEPAFKGLLSLMRNATVAFTNFQMSVFDTQRFVPTPQAEYGGLWVHGTPQMAHELKWLGIDMVARANNHTADYGVEGGRAASGAEGHAANRQSRACQEDRRPHRSPIDTVRYQDQFANNIGVVQLNTRERQRVRLPPSRGPKGTAFPSELSDE